MIVLGIESSCDDTAAAILDDRGKIYADVSSGQDDIHARFGGVVPELASRDQADDTESSISIGENEPGYPVV